MWAERRRSGRKGLYQIEKLDKAATELVAEAQSIQANKGTRLARQQLQFNELLVSEEIPSCSDDLEAAAPEEPSSSSTVITIDTKTLKRKPLVNVAREAERFKTSNREASCICTAFAIDLGLTTEENTDLVVDKSKVHRIREKLRKKENECSQAPKRFIHGLEYDGRKDKTLVRNEATKGFRLEKEEHFCVLQQPGDKFLTHFTPATGGSEDICSKLKEVVIDQLSCSLPESTSM